MKLKFAFLFLCLTQFSFGQNNLPLDYFKSPLDIPLYLAGNFGELRDNHFHSGIDLKTQQRTGLDVMASADGYISRIKLRPYGYGRVIYVQHPNGFTSVYGHLKEFAPKIRAYVRQRMYKLEKNEITLYPEKGELPVKQGEVIALSGESGGAGGPHLHFEIRNPAQRPMNPLLFGIEIKDTRKPSIYGLYVYPTGDGAHVNRSARRQHLRLIKQPDGSYETEQFYAYGKLGFGIDALDHMDGSTNTDGLYRIRTKVNGQLRYDIIFNKFSFANSRYINRYIDYAYYKKHDKRIQKLFIQPNNNIDFSIDTNRKGYVIIDDSLNHKYEITIEDFAGNKRIIRVPIKPLKLPEDKIQPEKQHKTSYLAYADKANVFQLDYHDVYIPKGALYENTYLQIEDHPNKIKVHNNRTPLQKNITIGFDVSKYSAEDREKLYIARTYPWGTTYYSDTHKDGKRFTTRTRTFGAFKLMMDTTSPTVKPVNFDDGKWVSTLDYLRLKIGDTGSDIATYRGTINGDFIVMEYNYKTDTITYFFKDDVSEKTENHLKVIVVDNVGNSTTYEATFYRKDNY